MELALINYKRRKLLFIVLGLTLLVALVIILIPIFKTYKFENGVSYNTALENAVSERNPLLCELMTELVTYGDYSITNEDSISLCKAQYAILTKDLEYCMTLKETPKTYEGQPGVFKETGIAQRDICLKGLAHQLKKPELCELLNTATDSNYGEVYVKSCKRMALDPNYNPVKKLESMPDFDKFYFEP